jgi:hypothetical protein
MTAARLLGVAHAFHQLPEIGTGLDDEIVAGVSVVVEVDAREAGRC